jgi:hypothetical protein
MKHNISANEATYGPQFYKTFEGALEAFLSQECPQIGGFRTRQVLTSNINTMVRQYFPETSHLGQGQTPWVTVHKDAKGAYGKRIQDTKLTNVVLDLVRPQDIIDRANGAKLQRIKIEAVARLCKQAYEQDGCMTNAEMAILLKISNSTVGKYIKTWEEETREVLPRRGTIHDMGPTLTHKKIIIEKLFIEKKTVQQVSRETYHSLPAIQRYIGTFKKVLMCTKKEMTTEEKAYAIGITQRLTKEYEAIIEEYKDRGYVLDQISSTDIAVETAFDKAPNIK